MNNLNVFKKVRIGLILLVMFLISSTAWAVPTPSPVKYIDENGETKTITDYIELTGDESPDGPMFKNGGWFVVKGEVTYDEVQGHLLAFKQQIENGQCTGPDVNLILADGAKLTAKNENSEMSFRNLAVYAQSTGENMGKFEVYAENSTAISVFNAFTVYGGSVKAHSFEEYEYGIWAGSVTVNGGIVDAAGVSSGIRASDAKVIINGGSVTAAGFRGIFGSRGIEINGGDVDATATGVSEGFDKSYAIGSWYDVNVNGGSLTVHAKDKSRYGIFTEGVAYLNAGEVFADGEGSGIAARPTCSSSGVELAGATVTTNRYTYIDDLGTKSGFFVKVANDVLYTDGEGNFFEGFIFECNGYTGETIDKRNAIAGKTLRPVKPNIVVTQDGEGKIHAEINGNYIGEDDFIITDRIEVDEVKFERDFTTEGYSTIVLPFNIKTSLLVGVDSVLSFDGIVLDENKKKAVAMQVVWEKTSEEVELQAYTPYMIKMSDKSLEILGSVVLETTRDAVTEKDGWEFRGTYSFMKWTEDSPDLGRVYGFAASSEGDVSVGQFVKIAAGASIRPLRAYLIHNVPSTVRANGYYANRNVASIKDELPEQMNVVIVGKDKNGEEHTTVIGQFNTRSGEFRANSVKRVYDLKGRPMNKDARKVRGAYYGKNLLH